MAKGNLFLGTAARSVGDVVMYRREGSQVSRVRVRKIANPKTDAQCEQRAFMSAVVKFYQPLANVLDRSWQGLSRAKSYAKFLKTNAGIVRAGGYYLPKDSGFFPLPLQLSNGTITPLNSIIQDNKLQVEMTKLPDDDINVQTFGQLSTILISCGYKEGDVVTIIVFSGTTAEKASLLTYQFVIDPDSTTNINQATGFLSIANVSAGDEFLNLVGSNSIYAGAIIIARPVDGQWQRSKQILAVDSTVLTPITSAQAKAAAIASYKGAAASDNPLVYLDGDELDNA